jgi:predicted TIM-barrel fold metal-dependent hydrolase
MIDCHVHAFPDLEERAGQLRVKPLLGSFVDASSRVAGWLSQRLPAIRGVERAARHNEGPASGLAVDLAVTAAALPQVLVCGTVDRLLRSMDRHAIRQSLLIAAPPLAGNDWVVRRCASSEGRLVPVVALPALPPRSDEKAWAEALRTLAERGACGFKIHPNMDALDPDHPAYRAMFEVAREKRLFIILHTGHFRAPGYRRAGPSEPAAFAHLFAAYPGVLVCLAHMNRERPEAAWEQLHRFGQLYADTSWQPADTIRRAVAAVGASRLLVGSDWPLLHGDLQGEVVELVRRAVSDSELEQIAETNPVRFLGGA